MELKKMYPLSVALEVLGVKPGKFHRHFYGGALGNTLAETGKLNDHITQRLQGAGTGRGDRRFITLDGVICLGVFFQLIAGGIRSGRALNIAQIFAFLGEDGNGLRAFKPNTPRPAGDVFLDPEITFLVAISNIPAPETGEGQGFAFVPGSDFNAATLSEWLGLHDADGNPVCIFNLSEMCRNIRSGLSGYQPVAVLPDSDHIEPVGTWSEKTSDPLCAFMSDYAIDDKKGRTPTRDFYRAFFAWYADWTGTPMTYGDGQWASHTALQGGLSAFGIRKMKSNGIMTFAGFRWRDTPAVQRFLTAKP